MSQLNKCLKFMAFRGVILYRIQSFVSLRMGLDFRHLSSCDTIVFAICLHYLSKADKVYFISSRSKAIIGFIELFSILFSIVFKFENFS